MDFDVIGLVSSMIRIDSRNVLPLDVEGERVAYEEEMGDFVECHLVALGFAIERQYIAEKRPHVIGRRIVDPSYRTLCFEAHLDTVGTDGMTISPFEPVVSEGKLYGRGSCDTKGSMGAMLVACKTLIDLDLPLNLVFIAGASEETGVQGTPLLELRGERIDGIVVGEPTLCRMVVAHKTHDIYDFTVRGRSAHSSNPDLGDNAIVKASRLVLYLEDELRPYLSSIRDLRFEIGCTMSVGIIHGGVKCNIVPDECKVTVDVRRVPGALSATSLGDKVICEMKERFGVDVELTRLHSAPGMGLDEGDAFMGDVQRALSSLGYNADPMTVSYCTDAGPLSEKGYSCVVLGPGNIAQAHTACEYVALDELHKAVEIYVEIGKAMSSRAGVKPS